MTIMLKGNSNSVSRRLVLGGMAGAAAFVGARPARAQQTDKIKIAALSASSEGPLFIAESRGYFKDEGLDAELVMFSAGGDVVTAIPAGGADVGVGAFTASFFNIAAKTGMRIIAGQVQEKPHYHNTGFVATNAAWDAGLKTVKDLKGHRVGITTTGGGPHLALGLAAEKYGFTLADMTVVPLQSIPGLAAGLKGGQVDAGVIGTPNPAVLESQHVAHIIGWMGDETPTQFAGAFAMPATIDGKRPALEKFLRAYAKGAHDYWAAFNQLDANFHLVKGPGYDDLAKIIGTKLGIDPALIVDMPYVTPDVTFDAAGVAHQGEFWVKIGAVQGPIDMSKIIDRSFGKAV